MTDYTKDDSIDPERMGQWTMASKLPYTLSEGVTATREGLDFNPQYSVAYRLWDDYCEPWIVSPGETLRYEWPDAAERLRYREGEPWCHAFLDEDGDEDIICRHREPWPLLAGEHRLLHRLAAILCDDAESFRVLHWCVTNLGTKS